MPQLARNRGRRLASDAHPLRYQDLAGVAIEREADGLLARCVLHEVDHLNGILFIDRLAAPERERLAGKLAKLRKLRQERLVQAS